MKYYFCLYVKHKVKFLYFFCMICYHWFFHLSGAQKVIAHFMSLKTKQIQENQTDVIIMSAVPIQ